MSTVIPSLPPSGSQDWYGHYTALDTAVREEQNRPVTTVAGGTLDDRMAVLATPQRFAGIDATGATSSTAGLQAAHDATPDGGTLIIPPGTYLSTGRINSTDKSIRVQAYGATFLVDHINAVFRATATFGTTYSVTAQTPTQYTDSRGATLLVTDLTVDGTPNYVSGDLLKIAADNEMPHMPGSVTGQFVQVVSSSGSTVRIAGRLRDPMTTNVRLAKASHKRVEWSGGTFTTTDAILAGTTMASEGMIFLRYYDSPVVRDIRVTSAAGVGAATFRGCWHYQFEDSAVEYCQSDGTKYGYGFNDDGSNFGVARNIEVRNATNLLSTNGGTATAGSNVGDFSECYGLTVTNCLAYGMKQSAFSTHTGGSGVRFIDCQIQDCYRGYALRGREHQIIGGFIRNTSTTAIEVHSTGGGDAYGLYVGGGVVMDNIGGSHILIHPHLDGRGVGVKETRPCIVDDVVIKNRQSTSDKVIDATNATVLVGRVSLVTGSTGGTLTSVSNADILPLTTLAV